MRVQLSKSLRMCQQKVGFIGLHESQVLPSTLNSQLETAQSLSSIKSLANRIIGW